MVNSEENMASLGGISLDHKHQNHYNVVTSVSLVENVSEIPSQKLLCLKENTRKIADRNQKRQQRESCSVQNERC